MKIATMECPTKGCRYEVATEGDPARLGLAQFWFLIEALLEHRMQTHGAR